MDYLAGPSLGFPPRICPSVYCGSPHGSAGVTWRRREGPTRTRKTRREVLWIVTGAMLGHKVGTGMPTVFTRRWEDCVEGEDCSRLVSSSYWGLIDVGIQVVTCDMWRVFIATGGAQSIRSGVLDRFHVMHLFSDAVDRVRSDEVRRLRAQGDTVTLKHNTSC